MTLEHPFVLAPMAGITDSPFRQLMRRHGASLVVSELVSANGLAYASQKTKDMLKFKAEERPLGLQIFGEDASRIAEAAKYVQELGADFVDLNFGCPVPKVVNKGAGAAMMKDVPAMYSLLKQVVAAVRIPVSIKIRTGWEQSALNAVEVVRAASDAGVAFVSIHGRTRSQGYSGLANWDYIGEVKAKSPVPIIGNGDVQTVAQAFERYQTYGVDAVMIGRGILRNPFLFEQCRSQWQGQALADPMPCDYVALFAEQRELYEQDLQPHYAMLQARKFLAWYAAGYSGCHEFRRFVFECQSPEQLWKESERFFSQPGLKRDPKFLTQTFLAGGHG